MNYGDLYLVEGFLHNLCPYFDIVFAPLGLITRTSNNIVEIAVTSECYLNIKIVGNYNMKLGNKKLSEFHFQFSIRSVYIENWREVVRKSFVEMKSSSLFGSSLEFDFCFAISENN